MSGWKRRLRSSLCCLGFANNVKRFGARNIRENGFGFFSFFQRSQNSLEENQKTRKKADSHLDLKLHAASLSFRIRYHCMKPTKC